MAEACKLGNDEPHPVRTLGPAADLGQRGGIASILSSAVLSTPGFNVPSSTASSAAGDKERQPQHAHDIGDLAGFLSGEDW